MLQQFFPLFLALALTASFFEKGAIGVVMGIMVIVSGYVLWRNKSRVMWREFIQAKETWLIFIVLLVWFVSSLNGLNPEKALAQWAKQLGMVIGGLFIWAGCKYSNFDFKQFQKYIFTCVSVVSGYTVVASLFPEVLPIEFISNSYASVIALLFPFSLVHVLREQRKWQWMSLALHMMAVFAIGGRTGWFTLGIMIIFGLIFLPWKAYARPAMNRAVLIVLMLVSIPLGVLLYKNTVSDIAFSSRVSDVDMARPASGRTDLWMEVLPTVEAHRWIGTGLKGFREIQLTHSALHAHNVVLELLVDTGVMGLLTISLLVGYMVIHFGYQYLRNEDMKTQAMVMPVFLSAVGYGFASMALTSFFHAWWFLYCVALLILFRLATDHLKTTSQA